MESDNIETCYGDSTKDEELEKSSLPDSDVTINSAKCGDIYVLGNGSLIFSCYFCEERYSTVNIFTNHIHKVHLDTDSADVNLFALHEATDQVELSPSVDELETNDDTFQGCIKEIEEIDVAEFDSTNDLIEENADCEEETVEYVFIDQPSGSPKSQKKFWCQICREQFSSLPTLLRHKKTHKIPRVPPIDHTINEADEHETDSKECRYCGKTFAKRTIRIDHERIHTGEKPYQCAVCLQFFRTADQERIHSKVHTGEKPYQCQVCAKCFRTSAHLKIHETIHTGERSHKCHLCPSAFSQKSNLMTHIRAHLGEKRYKCNLCEKSFVRSSDRTIHIRMHTGEKNYTCDECGKSFTCSSRLTTHKKYRHYKTKSFCCEICNKKFATNPCLKNHMASHSNERPYKCDICLASFSRSKTLVTHKNIHSTEKRYVCKICKKAYAQQAGLYTHMKTHGFHQVPKNREKNNSSDS